VISALLRLNHLVNSGLLVCSRILKVDLEYGEYFRNEGHLRSDFQRMMPFGARGCRSSAVCDRNYCSTSARDADTLLHKSNRLHEIQRVTILLPLPKRIWWLQVISLRPHRKPILWIDVEAVVVAERHCWRRSISFSSFYNSDQRSRYGSTSRRQFGLKGKYGYAPF
jgi:hypothetical protein